MLTILHWILVYIRFTTVDFTQLISLFDRRRFAYDISALSKNHRRLDTNRSLDERDR